MTRQNVYAYPDPDNYLDDTPVHVVGHFNLDAARHFDEGRNWDGSNYISQATGSQWDHEALYLTAGGRWVKNWWSQWQGSTERWTFIDVGEAREWLLRNEYDDDTITAATGTPVEQEEGPVYGRPQIGRRVEVILPKHVITALDARAVEAGVKRSELIRDLICAALNSSDTPDAPTPTVDNR